MHKERNVKTKASAFTRVEKVCMRVIGVERLNMQLYLFYWMLCMCECLCVGARHEISSQQRYQGNCSESDRGGKLFVSFTSEFLSVNSLDQNCLLFGSHRRPFKSHLSQRRVRVGVIHKYTQHQVRNRIGNTLKSCRHRGHHIKIHVPVDCVLATCPHGDVYSFKMINKKQPWPETEVNVFCAPVNNL